MGDSIMISEASDMVVDNSMRDTILQLTKYEICDNSL